MLNYYLNKMTQNYSSQNSLLLTNLMTYYKTGENDENENLERMLRIINGDVNISLRIVDWFTTNYAKKHYTVYNLPNGNRFKVYNDYKLKLKDLDGKGTNA